MGKRQKHPGFEDDGRVVSPMNVEGMPWYAQRDEFGIRNPESGIESREQGGGSSAQMAPPPILTRRENLAFLFGVLKAALLVSFIFIGALLAFILFCTEIWFRI